MSAVANCLLGIILIVLGLSGKGLPKFFFLPAMNPQFLIFFGIILLLEAAYRLLKKQGVLNKLPKNNFPVLAPKQELTILMKAVIGINFVFALIRIHGFFRYLSLLKYGRALDFMYFFNLAVSLTVISLLIWCGVSFIQKKFQLAYKTGNAYALLVLLNLLMATLLSKFKMFLPKSLIGWLMFLYMIALPIYLNVYLKKELTSENNEKTFFKES